MKIIVTKTALSDVLTRISAICARASFATNAAVLIEAVGDTAGSITISATDLETGYQGTRPAVVLEPGKIFLDEKTLQDIVRKFPEEEIKIELSKGLQIRITPTDHVQPEYILTGLNPDDFPRPPDVDTVNAVGVSGVDLGDCLSAILTLKPVVDSRAHVKGVMVTGSSEGIQMVTTGPLYVAMKYEISNVRGEERNHKDGFFALVPKTGLQKLVKILQDKDYMVGVFGNHFFVKTDDELIVMIILEGDFPDTTDIFTADERKGSVSIDRAMLISVLTRMSLILNDAYKASKIEFSLDGDTGSGGEITGSIVVESSNPEIGTATETIPDVLMKIPPSGISVYLNPKILIELVKAHKIEMIDLEFGEDTENPGQIIVQGNENLVCVLNTMVMA